MANPLKRVNLMLDEQLVKALRRESRRQSISMPALVPSIPSGDLGIAQDPREVLAQVRALREQAGPMSDSTAIIREYRDRGW